MDGGYLRGERSAHVRDEPVGLAPELPHGLDDLPDGVLILDRLGTIQHMNAALGGLLQREPSSTVGCTLQQVVAEEEGPGAIALLTLLQARRLRDINLTFSLPDGSRRQLCLSSARARDGQHVLFTARPVGRMHRELEDASLWVAKVHERSLSVSQARDALATKNAALEAAHRELAQAYARLQEETAAREQLQQQLNLARRLEAIGQLSAGIAHEINTPLQYVGDSVHFLGKSYQLLLRVVEHLDELGRAGPPASWSELRAGLSQVRAEARLDFVIDELPRAVQAARDGIEHVSSIVRALKVFAHKGADEKGPADLNAALQNTLLVAQNEYRDVAAVQVQLGALPPVPCHVSQLNQVFSILIVNAARAIAAAAREREGVITVASQVRGDFAEVSIADDGCGIPEAVRQRLQEQVFTSRVAARDAGQGLSLAYQIIVAGHGGTLGFVSEPGRGTTFTVRLPIAGASAGSGLATAAR